MLRFETRLHARITSIFFRRVYACNTRKGKRNTPHVLTTEVIALRVQTISLPPLLLTGGKRQVAGTSCHVESADVAARLFTCEPDKKRRIKKKEQRRKKFPFLSLSFILSATTHISVGAGWPASRKFRAELRFSAFASEIRRAALKISTIDRSERWFARAARKRRFVRYKCSSYHSKHAVLKVKRARSKVR